MPSCVCTRSNHNWTERSTADPEPLEAQHPSIHPASLLQIPCSSHLLSSHLLLAVFSCPLTLSVSRRTISTSLRQKISSCSLLIFPSRQHQVQPPLVLSVGHHHRALQVMWRGTPHSQRRRAGLLVSLQGFGLWEILGSCLKHYGCYIYCPLSESEQKK